MTLRFYKLQTILKGAWSRGNFPRSRNPNRANGGTSWGAKTSSGCLGLFGVCVCVRIYSYIYIQTLRIQICPKKGIISTILFWGWDLDHQSYSREGSGFLGIYIYMSLYAYTHSLWTVRPGWCNEYVYIHIYVEVERDQNLGDRVTAELLFIIFVELISCATCWNRGIPKNELNTA